MDWKLEWVGMGWNGLEWVGMIGLTGPSCGFCGFWGFCFLWLLLFMAFAASVENCTALSISGSWLSLVCSVNSSWFLILVRGYIQLGVCVWTHWYCLCPFLCLLCPKHEPTYADAYHAILMHKCQPRRAPQSVLLHRLLAWYAKTTTTTNREACL